MADKSYVCKECQTRFVYKATLQKHMHVHTNRNLFYPEIFKKLFAMKRDMKMQLFASSQEIPLVCELCQKAFADINVFKKHCDGHVKEGPPLACTDSREELEDINCLEIRHDSHKNADLSGCIDNQQLSADINGCDKHHDFHMKRDSLADTHNPEEIEVVCILKKHYQSRVTEPFVCDSNQEVIESPLNETSDAAEERSVFKKNREAFAEKSSLKEAGSHSVAEAFVCKESQEAILDVSVLDKHTSSHIEEVSSASIDSQKGYADESPLEKECYNHTVEDLYVFREENEIELENKKALEKHSHKQTREKRFVCKLCQKAFGCKTYLNAHFRTHTGEKPFECNICQKTFSHKSTLRRHTLVHTNEKKFKCDECQKAFARKSVLKSHLLIHAKEKPFVCEVCPKQFTQKGALKAHLRTHTGEKPFECKKCQKAFPQKGHLKSHLQIHAGEKPYACQVCQKAFSQKWDLKEHLRSHSGEKPFVCGVCLKAFAHKKAVKQHLRTHS